MTTKNLNQNNEKPVFNLEGIRLSEQLIDEINRVQTGEKDPQNQKVEDRFFNNDFLDDTLEQLESLNDFILDLFENSEFPDTDGFMYHLCDIRKWKNHFNAFRV
ncbi:MAG TPA: hypothetical protein VFC67_22075 [Prolixibacteraceae bacterium]|nr:hypothetical protein [Prolixibacteraceae bacterium]